ncbi:PilZ domain-containing protein [Pseudobutyrivibrio xylanivorans]|uniref:PilZ domain-containing protein n=1 Tax=Pseudobutyrivibrio xylanivorans TaxID=185007 RepID=A0A5P6VRY6_PSEXY|nr:PilZ domain-containing protein [Pseudobutyrivibrio xylanivorans]QFJ55455.1 PilZ domain-containing protein [Pseudobutyrivibrio xylanivorans]
MDKNILTINKIDSQVTLSIIAILDNKKMELPVDYVSISDAELANFKSIYGSFIVPVGDVVKEWEEQLFKVSFKGHLSKLELIAVTDEGVYRWGDVKIFKVRLQSGKNIQLLKAMCNDGQKFNRRRGVRVDLDRRMNIEMDGQYYNVLIRDMSYCGVGFVNPESLNISKGQPFFLHLTDFDSKGEPVELARLVCKVVNTREKNGVTTSGCIISSNHAQFLQRYIAKKQMEEISGKREFVGYQKNVEGENWQKTVAAALEKKFEEKQEMK